jgi:hypothetical protein
MGVVKAAFISELIAIGIRLLAGYIVRAILGIRA